MKRSAKGNMLLFMAAIIWGCALVAQKAGMSHLGPFGFTAIRCTIGGLVLLPLIWHLDKKKSTEEKQKEAGTKETIIGSVWCGLVLTSLILFQQFGLPYTTVGKAGFITALYILLTPVMGIFLGKKAGKNLWIGVVIGLAGMYMLCLYEGVSGLTFGDLMMLCAAVMAAAHIHVIDYFVQKIDPVKLSAYQFIFTGLICVIPMFVFEEISIEAIVECAIPILYAGLISCGLGYTFQIIGQTETDPSLASLILSLETVFSLFAGWIFFKEVLSGPEYIGCALMFIAIMVSQLPDRKKSDRLRENRS
ncbi:MAG: DMT family transporter [Bacillota bacterium]|nr:DMT family transporter [Bacillota bacterium]